MDKNPPKTVRRRGTEYRDTLGNIINPKKTRHERRRLGLSPRQYRKYIRAQRRLAKSE
jgi:hypothetical protein